MTQLQSILVLIILIIWERTCNYLLNTKKELKMPEFTVISKQIILWVEHIALISTGFIAGAIIFYFRSKYYLKTRLFTKDEVREIVHMALGEELTNVKRR